MTLDLGDILQVVTISVSMLITWLMSRKGYERWGYLVGLCAQPLWNALEIYYHQWIFLVLTPLYFIWWIRGLRNHWRTNDG